MAHLPMFEEASERCAVHTGSFGLRTSLDRDSVSGLNLTIRTDMRRFTRLTNGFSRKIENHAYVVALHMLYHNFVRIHKTLKVSPAMAAGVTDRLWEIGNCRAG